MVEIRRASTRDSAAIAAIYAPYVRDTAITFELEAPGAEEMARRIERVSERHVWLVAEEAGRIVGYAYAGPLFARAAYERSVEPSIYVERDERGRGIGGVLYSELERELRALGYLGSYARVAVPEGDADPYLTWNSVRFHERLGYAHVGTLTRCGEKFGRPYGIWWMEKLLEG